MKIMKFTGSLHKKIKYTRPKLEDLHLEPKAYHCSGGTTASSKTYYGAITCLIGHDNPGGIKICSAFGNGNYVSLMQCQGGNDTKYSSQKPCVNGNLAVPGNQMCIAGTRD
jgi:hypothetical protein